MTSFDWQYPLLVDGEPRADVTVAYFEGRWQVVGLGGPLYAPGLLGILRSMQADMTDMTSRPNVRLINIREYATYLALIERNGVERVVVLGSQLPSMDGYQALYEGSSTSFNYRTDSIVDHDPAVILAVLQAQYTHAP